MYTIQEPFTHLGTKKLETSRLILRQFLVSDAPAMYRNWAADPEVSKFLTWPPHESPEATAQLLKTWVDNYSDREYYQWAIVLKENGPEPIGSISAFNLDNGIRKAEIGYCIGQSWRHRGIMTEALAEVIRFLIEEVGIQRIEARHDPANPHSGAVMKKCGMAYEGTLRRCERNNQGIVDVCVYSILGTYKTGR